MDPNTDDIDQAPSASFGVKWEIVLITMLVLVVLVLGATTWFQIRRKRRLRQLSALDPEMNTQRYLRSHSSKEKRDSGYDSEVTAPDPVANPPRHPKYTRSMASTPTSESSHDVVERQSKSFPSPRHH